MLAKVVRIGLLNDFYGCLLTERQAKFIELYYNDDLSLSEIAEKFSISRQGVYDILRRSVDQLEEYESKLKLMEKHFALKGYIENLKQLINEFKDINCSELREKIDKTIELLKQIEMLV
ncbi:MAG: uncharacterized protein PWQ82_1094 [Thermosediminibacterales bacterium]|nr:uncharacterized protein [Thermosediminibacterales bacterium]MDK2835894.1 uncharacterized protein [Thermosediminibacterales bacterium]